MQFIWIANLFFMVSNAETLLNNFHVETTGLMHDVYHQRNINADNY